MFNVLHKLCDIMTCLRYLTITVLLLYCQVLSTYVLGTFGDVDIPCQYRLFVSISAMQKNCMGNYAMNCTTGTMLEAIFLCHLKHRVANR